MSVRFDRAVGIDLGTTNSEIALLPPSERSIWLYADRFGRRTVASALAWDERTSAFVVGNAARARRLGESLPLESIKRKMGTRDGVALGPHTLLPEEVAAKILQELVVNMRAWLAQRGGDEGEAQLTRAVITVPAYFDAPQVEATRRAGELAGLEVTGILQEPTAAAIYHVWQNPALADDAHVLVYDLGGGTFDVSVLRTSQGEYQVLALDGDNFLGGDDFDRRFAESLRQRLVHDGYALELDVRGDEDDRRRFQKLVHLAQEIKEALSSVEVVAVAKSNLLLDQRGEPVAFEAEIGRDEYESCIADLVEATIAAAERAVASSRDRAGVDFADIDHVLLVGGSTRVPLVARRVREALASRCRCAEPLVGEVDACVALGAAVHAAALGGTRLHDERARVVVTSPLTRSGDKSRLAVRVETFPPDARSLAIWSGEHALAEAALETPRALRFDLDLRSFKGDVPLSLAFQSELGAPLAELGLTLHHGDAKPRPSALTRATVLPKDIAVEVVRGGRRETRVLLARGTGLPARVSELFFTSDHAGAIVLPLLQNRLPLDTLMVEVDRSLPVGSPIELTILCDEAMRIEASAEVGGVRVQSRVAPGELGTPPDAEQLEALLTEAERARASLLGELGHDLQRELEWLLLGVRESLRTDPDRFHALCRRLRGFLDEHVGLLDDELSPPRHTFEQLGQRTRRVALVATRSMAGLDAEEWVRRIDALLVRGAEAARSKDHARWRRVNEEMTAIFETLTIEQLELVSTSDPRYAERLALRVGVRMAELERKLEELGRHGEPELRALRQAELVRLGQWLSGDLGQRYLEAKRGLRAGREVNESVLRFSELIHELGRIDTALARLPALGLSTDREKKTP